MYLSKQDDFERSAAIVSGLEKMKNFFSKKLTAERVQIYQNKLKWFPLKVIEAAFRKAKEQHRFFPSPSELAVLAAEELPAKRKFNEKPVKTWFESDAEYDLQWFEFAGGNRQVRLISKKNKPEEAR